MIHLGYLLMAAQASLLAQGAGEYEIKAAFLYKFAGFVQWPDNPANSPVCIGVVGQDPFGPALDEAVKGKKLNGRPFVVRRFRNGEAPPACQIVFVSSSERLQLRLILNRLPPAVLTVGDMPGFCESGGIIGFEVLDRRVHLQINLDAAQKERLQISSKLLSLAKLVAGAIQ